MQSIIEVNDIQKSFQVDFWKKPIKVLRGLSFDIQENQIVGLIGANGSGKTTFLKILMGLIKADAGQILYGPYGSALGFKRVTGFLPERPYFYPYLKGIEFVTYQSKLHGLSGTQIKERVKQWASRLKIDYALERKINTYSKGMLQRLGFLTLLVNDPEILIMDEPLSGLDPIGRKEFKDIIREVNSLGKTIFFSSHVLADIEEVSHKVLVLNEGKVQFQGPLEEIYQKNPPSQYEVRTLKYCEPLERISSTEKIGNAYCYILNHSDYAKALEILSSSQMAIKYFGPHNYNLESIVYNLRE